MANFAINNLTKSVGEKTVFKNLSFMIHDLDRIGLIGVNGTGKTTLLDVISGQQGFDGDISPFDKPLNYKITYLTQLPDFKDEDSILDAILDETIPQMRAIKRYERALANFDANPGEFEKAQAEMDALDAWNVENDVKTIVSKLDLPEITTSIGLLSGGQKRRVQLAQALLNDSDLLLLDEPTNHLDVASITWLQNYLKNAKRTVLFITHDRYFLDNVATRIFELADGNLTEYQGNYQDYVMARAEADEREAAAQHKRKQLYKQELEWMRKSPQARATKQHAREKRFEDLEKQVKTGGKQDDLAMNFATTRLGKKVIKFEDANFAFDNKSILKDFNLIVQPHTRLGIVGDNGAGKSTLLNIINGDLKLDSGLLDIGETVKIGYFSQDIRGLDESKRMINFLEEVASESTNTAGQKLSIVDLLEQFLFPRSIHGTLISKLSGGEKKRLYLLKILLTQPNVLLLDEPTNDLDIATLTVLEDFLENFPGAVITVSHDRYFLDKTADILLAFENGQINSYHMLYSEYLDQKSDTSTATAKTVEKVERVKEKKERLTYFEQKEWATIEDEISALEEKISELEQAMIDNASDYGKLAPLQKDLDEANDLLLEKYERYEYLSERA
jgi:ATP-binding cassette subfamily F protein uup